jgi:hypothetical protein
VVVGGQLSGEVDRNRRFADAPFSIHTETAREFPSVCTDSYGLFGLFVLSMLFLLSDSLILFKSINASRLNSVVNSPNSFLF